MVASSGRRNGSSRIGTVGVVGLGTMGAGIVEVFAKAGLTVVGVDGTPELAERGKGFLTKSTGKAVARGRLSEADETALLGRVTWSSSLTDLADVDLVVEAIPERLEFKTDLFTSLDDIVRPDTILASNTSSLSLTTIAAATKHPERVIGMHFFNPAPVLALVEVISTLFTDSKLVREVRDLATRLGKKPVVVGDRAGFVANALLITYLARAIRLYETGTVSREDLDNAMRVGAGFPMGPLTLSDLIGLDVVKEVCDVLYDATKDPSAAPPALLQQMVTAGRLGRKTGQGFYDYADSTEQGGSGRAPAVDIVALLGTGEALAQLGDTLEAGGLKVVHAAASSAGLSEAQIVFVGTDAGCATGECAAGACECDQMGPAQEAVSAGLAKLGPSAILAPADGLAEWAIGTPDEHARAVVPVRLHEPTKGGQVLEIGTGLDSGAREVAAVRVAAVRAGLVPVVGRARSGLLVDALLYPHLNDAVAMLDSGYASAEDIDTAMTAGCGYPEGPFAMIDRLGAEQVTEGLAVMASTIGGAEPSPLLVEHAVRGRKFLG
ncbi:3-hydroxybutyryl-CoA dehydrogenase [Branchiibius sp. NY16-3462-2]|uniref:3-hydroxybutyryl-CoA dehydrogenase n=1 Tax=Branchiibius sp. NY16-3462-2 TaxID=1807500 RepID=UPI00079641EF|nr:3-hydroxybutyryl-CoA dehydrogenase [Branchiibius sp. NY16-3462-2]KYH45809.1 3-hydroxyacyl-CoA dehydrogenase [Branchiibius sp. NY16-3462-2]